jgi:hypothetical protein
LFAVDPSRILQFRVTGGEQKRKHFEVTENETIHFICIVESNPVSSILLSSKEQEVWRNAAKRLIYTHRVKSCFDDGVYNCSAHNEYNNKPSKEVLTLRVRCKFCLKLSQCLCNFLVMLLLIVLIRAAIVKKTKLYPFL